MKTILIIRRSASRNLDTSPEVDLVDITEYQESLHHPSPQIAMESTLPIRITNPFKKCLKVLNLNKPPVIHVAVSSGPLQDSSQGKP